jgi:hypothetical protein
MPTRETIKRRANKELFDTRLMDNAIRGYWCEAMVAEALGSGCEIVGGGWNAWDIQIGEDLDAFPDRIRIQVKSSARLQVWNKTNGKLSDSTFNLTYRKKPSYQEEYMPYANCEDIGFLCDLYILCLHDEADIRIADQRDPSQWKFYLVPVVGENCYISKAELANAHALIESGKQKSSSFNRRPETMEKGIRGWDPITPLALNDLSIASVFNALGLHQK